GLKREGSKVVAGRSTRSRRPCSRFFKSSISLVSASGGGRSSVAFPPLGSGLISPLVVGGAPKAEGAAGRRSAATKSAAHPPPCLLVRMGDLRPVLRQKGSRQCTWDPQSRQFLIPQGFQFAI